MSQGRRHVLVIASQCENKAELGRLREAARALDDVLRDADIGACRPGLRNGESLNNKNLKSADIVSRVREAIAYAAEEDATLVLGLLGHGFIPGNDPVLYLMGWDSQEEVRDTAVDVKALLTEAADRPGMTSVIGIIDTCTATAAAPTITQIATGTRAGKTRLSLSRELAGLLRTGVPRAGARVNLVEAKKRLKDKLAGQDIVRFEYDGADSDESEWLAHNRQVVGSGHLLGSYGATELHSALRTCPGGYPPPADFDALRALHDELSQQPPSTAIRRAVRVADSLIVAHQTVSFLRGHMAAELTTEALRRALATVGVAGGPGRAAAANAALCAETDAVERAALAYPRKQSKEGSCRPQTARFMLALADGAGIDPTRPEFQQWAASIGALVPFNDALRARTGHQAARRLRLIVSYYALAGEWPDEVGAWLLYDGKDSGHVNLTCAPDQPGAEKALVEAVDWAEEHAWELDASLERIEVAVPARMLLEWRPEEVKYGGSRLGVNYLVLSRWSQRLEPTQEMRRINRNVGKRMAQISGHAKGAPLHWLSAQQVGELVRLRAELGDGKHAPATGLLDRPGQDGSLVDLLLRYVPIVLWPQVTRLSQAHCAGVRTRWHLLPDGFLTAYRARWAETGSDVIADIRAVWDDDDWLRFCGTARA
jgi:hypothetical protein